MDARPPWTIVGQGLAGTCLAWQLWQRGTGFRIIDPDEGGSSRVAGGLVNPVTGKNFEPSPEIATFLPEAVAFYRGIGSRLGLEFWHPMPVLRLAASAAEWDKMRAKAERPEVLAWIDDLDADPGAGGWHGAMRLRGGGRLDTRAFLDASRAWFARQGWLETGRVDPTDAGDGRRVWCEGAEGLLAGRHGPHRCAKGEILTLRAETWDQTRIRVGAGGWLVPLGGGRFKCGATYDWEQLDGQATASGRERVEAIANRLGGAEFQVIDHQAAVRPILRRSQPVIGPLPGGGWSFNGMGSKGSLYAPGVAARLALWLTEGMAPDPWLDVSTLGPRA